jgi:putative ABC transport system permease protein
MRVTALALREFRANFRRNAIFGTILLLAIGVQLFTALSATASREAVSTYGTAVFGYAETYTTALQDPLSAPDVARLNTRLADIRESHPWFAPATAVDLTGYVSRTGNPVAAGSAPMNLRAVSPSWRLLTPAIADDDAWRSVTSGQRRSAALLMESAAAERLGITGRAAVTVVMDPPAPGTGAAEGEAAGAAPAAGVRADRIELPFTPVFGTYTERNKALATDALVNQSLLQLGHTGPQQVQVYWRCQRECPDTSKLVEDAAAAVGTVAGPARRIDQLDQFRPILEQQRREGDRFALIVLVLGTLAVAIVSTAFVEVRAPQFGTLRALGASRPTVAALALLENLLTALLVGVLAVGLGVLAGHVDPDRFNQIPEVRLQELRVPVSLYARTVLLTLAIGLLTGLAPAIRAYRSVRTS